MNGDLLTALAVALIGVVPAIIAIGSGRRRKLQLIQQEIAVFDALPRRMRASRRAMRGDIAKSIELYTTRVRRRFGYVRSFGFTVGWALAVIGYNLFKGDIPEDTLKQLRLGAAVCLIAFGAILMLITIVSSARDYFHLSFFAYFGVRKISQTRKIKKNEKIIEGLEKRAGEATARRRRQYEKLKLVERGYIRIGVPVPQDVKNAIRDAADLALDSKYEEYVPIDSTDHRSVVIKAMREKRKAFKRRF